MVRHQKIAGLLLSAVFLLGGATGYASESERISWISALSEKTADPDQEKLSDLLSPLDGKFRLLECRYKDAFLKQTAPLRHGKDDWDYSLSVKKIPSSKTTCAAELELTIKRTGASLESSGFALAFEFSQWNSQNYLLIPASVYNGNRNRIVNRPYAQGLDRADLYKRNLPQTTAPVPRLSSEPGQDSRIEVLTNNTTTPAICVFDHDRKHGFILLAEQGLERNGEILDHALIVEESPDRSRAVLAVSVPGVRERKPEFIGFSNSPDRGITWKTGDECKIRLQAYSFPAKDIPALLDQFMSVRKNLTGPNSPRNQLPKSEVLRNMAGLIDERFHAGEKYQFYCPENAAWISFGWIGGLMNTFPMLALGDTEHRNKVKSTFDFGLGLGQGKSGYFYGALNHDGKPFGREGYDETPEIVLTRKNADVLYWMIKQFMLFKKQGHADEINPDWEQRVKKLADAFVSTWNKERQWGNFVNNATGEIAVYNTSSGVIAIAGLALAARYYDTPSYLKVAGEAAKHYYDEFKTTGMTTGACADILQNADSETAIALTTALMTLYEATGDAIWLSRCRDAAHLAATWTVSCDYILPPQTPLAKHGAKLTGAVWASTQNKHGAPGFCTQSGDSLFRLYRQNGDERYAELLRDIIHAHAEGIQPNGRISERLTYCDADSRGSWDGRTGWNETNGAMMALEIPGIYVRTDMDRMYCFDHITASVKNRAKGKVILEITNPTSRDADVSVFAESGKEARKPLSAIAFPDWKHVRVKPGETVLFTCPQP